MPIPREHRWFGLLDAQIKSRTCFVMMPFSEPWSDSVWNVIQVAFAQQAVNCVRDTWMHGHAIARDIVDGIAQSTMLLADITGNNPNVFYEIGLAHAWERDVLLISQDATEIPFHLYPLRNLIYSVSPSGLEQLRYDLASIARRSFVTKVIPSSIEIISKPSLSMEAKFLGEWQGLWTGDQPGSLAHTLVVYNIFEGKPCVAYFWGNANNWFARSGASDSIEAGFRHFYGRFEGEALILEWPDVFIRYTQCDGGLIAIRTDFERIFKCSMRKVR